MPYPREKTPPGEPSGPSMEEEVQVEERLVGAVLGPSGRHVEEIKQYRWEETGICLARFLFRVFMFILIFLNIYFKTKLYFYIFQLV